MLNKKIIIICLFLCKMSFADDEQTSYIVPVKESEKLNIELRKKYGTHRPKEVLFLKSSIPANDRADLVNNYFEISYPKCFNVDLTIPGDPGVTVETSASVDFIRTKKCNLYSNIKGDPTSDFNRIHLTYDTYFSDPKLTESHPKGSKKFYRQMIDIDGVEGVAYMGVGLDLKHVVVSGWNVVVACKGKKNESFIFSIPGQRGTEVIETLKNKKFELPEDFKQIVSSFRCRKDR